MDLEKSFDRLLQLRSEEIKLADDKAAKLVATSLGGGVVTIFAQQAITKSSGSSWLAVLAIVAYGLATIFALLAIYPRRRAKPSRTIWSDIEIASICAGDEDWPKLISRVEASEAKEENAKLVIQLSRITNEKFDRLRKSAACFLVAVAFMFAFVAITMLKPLL